MIVVFDKKYLKELYTEGKASNKKYRFQPDIVQRYRDRIDMLKAADSPQELMAFKSLNYEELKGDKKGICSIRVNAKYRIEFIVEKATSDTFLTICNIIELSNRYK